MAVEKTDQPRAIVNSVPTEASQYLLHDLFIRNASDRIALSYTFDIDLPPREFTYAQLHNVSDTVAHELIHAGIYKRIIPVILAQTPELYVCILAILKSGNAFCPILPSTGSDRVRFICEDVDAPTIFTSHEGYANPAPHLYPRTIFIPSFDAQSDALATGNGSTKAIEISPEDLAYTMYTSGSTGTPKAVMISHSAASTSILAHDAIFHSLAPGDSFLQFANPTFDISIFEIFSAWARAMVLVSADRTILTTMLPKLIKQRQVKYMELTPSMAGLLPDKGHTDMSSVKVLITIGEMLTRRVIQNWAGKLYNAYGPTEATLHASFVAVSEVDSNPALIGGALPSCTLAILDPMSTAVLNEGTIGELCIAGPQVALGYLNRPDLTGASFIEHKEFHGRLYRTGDLAKIEGSKIHFHGRKQGDSQVKINGQRIELGEFEHELMKSDFVIDCAFVTVDKRLYAFVTTNVEVNRKVALERLNAIEHLPLDARPTYIIIDSIPSSASSKRDTRRLKDLAQQHSQRTEQDPESQGLSPRQTQILHVVRKVLGHDVMSRSTFASFGLDSLGAIKIVMELRSQGLETSVYDVLKHNTVVELENKCTTRTAESLSTSSGSARLSERKVTELKSQYGEACTFVSSSALQASMLSSTLSSPGLRLYCNYILLHHEGSVTDATFLGAWAALVETHEILRTGFHIDDDASISDFVQIIHPPVHRDILISNSACDLEKFIDDHKQSIELTHNNLHQPPVDLRILRRSSHEFFVSIVIHHALYDAWTLELLINDISNHIQGKPSKTSPQYKDTLDALAQLNVASNDTRKYWETYLRNWTTIKFPTLSQHDGTAITKYRTKRKCQMSLKALDDACSRLSTNPQAVGQLIWTTLLSWMTGAQCPGMAITISGRSFPIEELSRTLGPFITTYPFHLACEPNMTIQQALDNIKEYNLQLNQHHLSYRDILDCANCKIAPDTLFIYQKIDTAFDSNHSVEIVEEEDRTEFEVMLTFNRASVALEMYLDARINLISQPAAAMLLAQAENMLIHILERSQESIRSLTQMPKEFLSIANEQRSEPTLGRVNTLFENLEKADGARPALEFYHDLERSQIFTYAQLNVEANKLANSLIEVQTVPDEIIAICLHKSVAMYVSILAIWKLGCAYVALDPASPDERILATLDTTKCKHVFTDMANSTRFRSSNVINVEALDTKAANVVFEARPTKGLAYVIMTSGSTGIPKACAVTHSNVLSNNQCLGEIYPHAPGDRMLQFCSYTFDVSVFEIVFAWYHGMCLVSAARDLMISDLIRAMNHFRISHASMTTTAAALLRSADLPMVKCFITAGESASRTIIEDWGSSKRYYNAYGPTETTNVCTVQPITSSNIFPAIIGPMLRTSSGFVLGNDLTILPKLSMGELYVSGSQVIRGYLGDEEKTTASFIQHQTLGRLYRTGDLVRIMDDETIQFISRADSQVKVRGHRVELGEITHHLRARDDVEDATTILKGASLISFIILKPESKLREAGLAKQAISEQTIKGLRHKLPEYMVPARIIALDHQLPMTSSHKLDTRRLLAIAEESETKHDSIPDNSRQLSEWTKDSRQIADIISRVSGVERADINADTSLFTLGLDSIVAIKVATGIRREGLGEIRVSTIMQEGTPAAIAASLGKAGDQLESLGNAHSSTTSNPFRESLNLLEREKQAILQDTGYKLSEIEAILPCTSLQTGILLETLKRKDIDYVNHSIITVQSAISPEHLHAGCQELVARHSALRTCFTFTAHAEFPCVQVVLRQAQCLWSERTTQTLPAGLKDWKAEVASRIQPQNPPIEFLHLRCGNSQYLVISLHHSIFDGWSLGLLHEDLDSICQNQPRRSWPNSEAGIEAAYNAAHSSKSQDSYWEGALRGYEPFSCPVLTTTSRQEQISLSRKLDISYTELGKIASSLSTSNLTLLHTSWALLVSHIVDSHDICFGSAVSGRSLDVDSIESMVTLLFNVLPVRVRLAPDSRVRSLLDMIHQVNLRHLEYPQYPLRNALKAARLKDGEALFDTILILQQPVNRSNLQSFRDVTDSGDNNYALMLEFVPDLKSDSLTIRMTSQSDQISQENLAAVAKHLSHILKDLHKIDDDVQTIHSRIATHARALSRKASAVARSDLLHSGFDRMVRDRPDARAVQYIEEDTVKTMTYSELGHEVEAVAIGLQELELSHSTPVVVMMSRVPDLFIAFLALLKVGMVYTPLAIDIPHDRLEAILGDLRPGLILVDGDSLKHSVLSTLSGRIQVATLAELCRSTTIMTVAPARTITTDLAYIIYTSGSTGGPKGVLLTHAAAVAAIQGSQDLLDLTPRSKWLQFASLTFDMSIYDMSVAFTYGICLCGAPKALLLSDLSGVVQRLAITHLDLTPSVAKILRQAELPSVELLFCIGERLSSSIISEWGSKCVNVYGPTEAAMACTSSRITEQGSVSQNIGFPFEHAQVGIFSLKDNIPLAELAIGELCIAGPQLCEGYLHDEQKTASAFFEYRQTKFYRTGDLCRLLADGSLAFIGRKDFQAKLRGQRIELEEISSELIARCDGVAAASTIITTFPGENIEQLVSFISVSRASGAEGPCELREISSGEVEQLIASLDQILPTYMIPSHLIRLNYIPLSSAQKVDRKVLVALWGRYTENLSESKERLHDIKDSAEMNPSVIKAMAEISGMEQSKMLPTMSIYQLGLDSISAIQIVAALKKDDIHISVIDVLRNPTIKKLSILIGKQSGDKKSNAGPNTQAFHALAASLQHHSSDGNVYPCTPVQENMIAQFLNTEGKAYYNHMLLRLDEEVDLNHLKSAWIEIITAFEILRSGFIAVNTKQCQYALKIHDVSVAGTLVEIKSVSDVWQATEDAVCDFRNRLINNLALPSLHITLFDVEGGSNFLLFAAHHAIYDGYSLQLIFKRLKDVLKGGGKADMEPIEPSLAQLWSLYHDQSLQKEILDFWNNALQASVSTPFPNLNNSVVKDDSSCIVALTMKMKLSDLEQKCSDAGASLPNIAMAAWAKILSAYTGEDHVTFGTVLSGRLGTGLEDSPIPCITTIPVPSTLEKSATEFVSTIADFASQSLMYQHVPLNRLNLRDATKLFDTLFVYQPNSEDALNTNLWQLERDLAAVEVPLSIEVIPNKQQDRCLLQLSYQEGRIPKEHATMILDQMEHILMKLVENPDQQILDIETDLPTELLSILMPENPKFDVPVALVHQHVAHFARHTPDAVAFEFAEDLESSSRIWTYAQLEAQSNQLANWLIVEHGLQGPAPIAICFDKCPEAFISILAVLKTGSPFCCLDSTAPIERRKFIIGNADASAVLCSSAYKIDLEANIEAKVIVVSDLDKLSSSSESPEVAIKESDLCYILYTSGSTGTPKGCCLTHRSVIQALASFQVEFKGRFDDQSRFLAFASLHFDVSILETYFSLSIGARVCAAPKDALLSDIPGAIRKFSITHLDLTPQLAMTLLPEDARSLRVFITGGEMLRAETVEHWGDSGVLFNFYGPTEVTIGCTALKQVKKGARPSNIGQQWSNCGSIVLSQLGRPKPALKGGLGDLIISGSQVAEGYMKLPEATSKRFGFSEILKDRTYDTGDLVRLLAIDKSFDFAGRADSQIKLRGQRIETGEIDSVLVKADSDIRDAVTLVLKHKSQQKEQLVSFVVFKGDYNKEFNAKLLTQSRKTAGLFSSCKDSLAGYMVPSFIIPVTRVELTPTNKVDSKRFAALFDEIEASALTALSPQRSSARSARADPEVVKLIKQALTEMTGAEDIDDHTSVFELGLDSVSVIGLVRKLKVHALNKCSVSAVMASEDIADLACSLSETGEGGDDKIQVTLQQMQSFASQSVTAVIEQLGIQESEIEDIQPCTPLIEGILSEAIQKGSMLHFNKFTISGPAIDSMRLKHVFDSLVHSTKILRTRFVLLPNGLGQVFLRPGVETLQRDNFPLQSNLVALHEVVRDHRTLYEFCIHHAIYDGQTLNMLFDDLKGLYDNPDSSSVCRQRPDFHEAVAEVLSLDLIKARAFWKEQSKEWQIRTTKRKANKKNFWSGELQVHTQDVETFARKSRCAPSVIFQACWAIILCKLYDGDACFGMVVAGRNLSTEGADEMVFPFFNTIPVYCATADFSDVSQLLSEVQSMYGKTIEYEHTPLREIKKLLSIQVENPLMDTLLVYQKEFDAVATNTQHLTIDDATNDSAGYAIALDVTLKKAGSYEIVMNVDGLDVSAQQLATHFNQVVAALIQGHSLSSIRDQIAALKQIETRVTNSQKTVQTDHADDEVIRGSPQAQNILRTVSEMLSTNPEEISIVDSFPILGLDSIDAIKLSGRLRHQHHYDVSVGDIMKNDSIAMLCRLLDSRSIPTRDSENKSSIPADFSERAKEVLALELECELILPVSPMQAGLLTSSRVHDEHELYLNHTLLKFSHKVNFAEVENAWNTIISTNQILRTSFAETSARNLPLSCDYVQLVHKFVPRKLELLKCKDDEILEKHNDFKKRNTAMCNLVSLAPFFLQVFETEECQYLAISIHHALYDGASLDMMFHDFQNCLQHRSLGKARPQYAMLVNHIQSTGHAKADLFWSSYLKDCKPQLKTSSGIQSSSRIESQSMIDVDALRDFSKKLGISLQAFIQTVYARYIMSFQCQHDIVFGTIQAGRSFAYEAERILGPCMNTVPIRAVATRETRFVDIGKAIHEANIEMIEHIHTPLRRIQRQMARGPLFETLLVFQNNGRATEPIDLWTPVEEDSRVEFPLAVECVASVNNLTWTIAVHDGYVDKPQSIARELDQYLAEMLRDSEALMFPAGANIFTTLDGHKESDDPSHAPVNAQIASSILEAIAQVAEVAIENLTRESSIFTIGMDSISVIELSKKLKTNGMRISVGEILRNPTANEMSLVLQHKGKNKDRIAKTSKISSLRRDSSEMNFVLRQLKVTGSELEAVVPASASQDYFVSAWKATKGRRFMSNFAYKLHENSDVQELAQRWIYSQEKHQILRTTFCHSEPGSRLLQCVFATATTKVVEFEAKAQSDIAALDEFFESAVFAAPDLTRPPLGLHIIKIAEKPCLLVISIHHALYDAFSLPLLVDELNYGSRKAGPRYLDVSAALASQVESCTRFWKHYLRGVSAFRASDFLSSSREKRESGSQVDHFSIGRSRSVSVLERLTENLGVTTQALFLVAISKVLAEMSGLDQNILGMYLGGRSLDITDIDSVMGPTVNVLPIRFDEITTTASEELVQQTHKALIDMNGFVQQVPIGILHSMMRDNEAPGGLIDVAVNVLPRRNNTRTTEGSRGESYSASFSEYGNLTKQQVKKIREIYANSNKQETPIDKYQGLDSCRPVLDIEIEVVDGEVNFGVFCDAQVFDEAEAEDFICQIWDRLMNI